MLSSKSIDSGDISFESKFLQLVPACTKRVCFDDICTHGKILFMDVDDQLWFRYVEFVEATVNENTRFVNHGPHRPVSKQDAILEGQHEWQLRPRFSVSGHLVPRGEPFAE